MQSRAVFVKRYGPLVIGNAVILALDQYTKYLVRNGIGLHESVPVINGFFNLTYVENRGAAFGFLAGAEGDWAGRFFILVTLIAVPLLVYLYREVEGKDPWLRNAMILVSAGAIGNLLDRLSAGGVTDFLDFHIGRWHWPAFNVADSCITVGVAIMVV